MTSSQAKHSTGCYASNNRFNFQQKRYRLLLNEYFDYLRMVKVNLEHLHSYYVLDRVIVAFLL